MYGYANLISESRFFNSLFFWCCIHICKLPQLLHLDKSGIPALSFDKVGGYSKISNLLMGDDSIFLQLCLKAKINVKFCLNSDLLVYCRPENMEKPRFYKEPDGQEMVK